MINYIIQVMLFQTLFLVVYDLVLSKETFFSKNRWYLLVTGPGAFIIPFLKVPTFQQTITREVGFALPEIVISPQHVIEKTAMYQSIDYVSLVFWSGLAFFATLFAVKMIKLFWLILNNHKEEREEYTLVTLSNSKKAFSFFNYIFLGDLVAKSEREKIIAHEQIHSQQKHTIDLLMFELLKTVMWFNPLLYIYQQKISAVHEYISDDFVLKSLEKKTYMNNLINQLFDVESISFVNQFCKKSLIKKRIKMMTKNKSKQIMQVKYLLMIPILASMLVYVSCSESEIETNLEPENTVINSSQKNLKEIEKAKVETIAEIVVPFQIIETPPAFPDCTGDNTEIKKCFHENIQRHFVSNFNSDIPKQIKLASGKHRIIMMLLVDKEGNVVDVKVKAPHPELEKEGKRILNLLPKMKPGVQRGKPVSVKYTLPMRIHVE